MQKRVGDKLYIFDLTPFVITNDTDAEVIFVQYEHMKGYKELNAELAEKIFGFNQFIMAVNPPEWAKEQPTPPGPEPEVHTLGLTGDNWNDAITLVIDGSEQDISETSTWDVEEGSSIVIRLDEDHTCYEVTGAEYDSEDNSYKATMPGEDLTITINYTAPVETYNFSLTGQDIQDNVHVYVNGDEISWDVEEQMYYADGLVDGDEIKVHPSLGESALSHYTPAGEYTWDSEGECWVWTIDGADISATIDYSNGESGESGESE